MTRNNSPIESQVSIPDGWIYGLIGGLCSMKGGGTPTTSVDKYWADDAEADGAIPWISISDMSQVDSVRTTEKSITPEGIEASSVTVGDPGTVLFAMYASVGEVAISELRATWNQAIVGLTPSNDERLESRFLFYALQSLKQFLPAYYRSNTQNNLNANTVARFRIPLPPLTEQSRIADFLDEETGEIDRVVGVLDELIEELDVRRSNTIREKMDEARELTIESGIATIPDLGYEAVLIRRGISPAYLEDGDEEPGSSIRVVNQKCIRSGSRIDYSLARRNDLSKKAVNKDLLIRPGDILINSTGTGTLGRTALVREVDEPTTFDSHVTLVRPKSSVDGGFLGYFMLNSEDILVLESRGSTNQIELSQNTVSWLELPLPSLDEQRRIADYLDEETSRIDNTKATATELREELIARRKAIITEYVTGQKRVG